MAYKKQKSQFFDSHRHFLSCLTNSWLQGRGSNLSQLPQSETHLNRLPSYHTIPLFHCIKNQIFCMLTALIISLIHFVLAFVLMLPDGSILTHSRIVPSVEPQTTLERETLQSAKSLNPASKKNPPNPNQIEQPWPNPTLQNPNDTLPDTTGDTLELPRSTQTCSVGKKGHRHKTRQMFCILSKSFVNVQIMWVQHSISIVLKVWRLSFYSETACCLILAFQCTKKERKTSPLCVSAMMFSQQDVVVSVLILSLLASALASRSFVRDVCCLTVMPVCSVSSSSIGGGRSFVKSPPVV